MAARQRMAEWVATGSDRFGAAVSTLTNDELRGPSALPGWTRSHVIGHVARNADALGNLLDWARTGVETPMYASPDQRAKDITVSAAQNPEDLVADLFASGGRLAARIATMPAEAWRTRVRSAKGRLIPATEVLWLRAREVWIHRADLTSGATFDDFPADFLEALIDDVRSALRVPVDDLRVTGSPAAVAGWLTGRSAGGGLSSSQPLPDLPSWL